MKFSGNTSYILSSRLCDTRARALFGSSDSRHAARVRGTSRSVNMMGSGSGVWISEYVGEADATMTHLRETQILRVA